MIMAIPIGYLWGDNYQWFVKNLVNPYYEPLLWFMIIHLL